MDKGFWMLLAALAMLSTTAMAQQAKPVDFGKREFENNCAACHGRDGKGGGLYVEYLKRSPPDLTTMTARNAGVFPLSKVYEVIEGAGAGHGGRDMPIWGQDYRVKAAEYYIDMPYDSEAYVRVRILALSEYVSRLQSK